MKDGEYTPYLVMANLNSVVNFNDKFGVDEMDISLKDTVEYTKHPDIVYFGATEEDAEAAGSAAATSTSLVRDAIDTIRDADIYTGEDEWHAFDEEDDADENGTISRDYSFEAGADGEQVLLPRLERRSGESIDSEEPTPREPGTDKWSTERAGAEYESRRQRRLMSAPVG